MRPIGPETEADRALREWFDEQERRNFDRLEEGAKTLTQLVTGLYGVLFAVLAFSDQPAYLMLSSVQWLGSVSVCAYFVALLAALAVVYPWRSRYQQDNLSAMQRAQQASLQTQQANLVEAIRSVLEKRINALGVSEATITPSYIGDEKHLLVECPGVVDTQECIKVVGKTIQLEFKEEFTEATEEYRTGVRARVDAVQRRSLLVMGLAMAPFGLLPLPSLNESRSGLYFALIALAWLTLGLLMRAIGGELLPPLDGVPVVWPLASTGRSSATRTRSRRLFLSPPTIWYARAARVGKNGEEKCPCPHLVLRVRALRVGDGVFGLYYSHLGYQYRAVCGGTVHKGNVPFLRGRGSFEGGHKSLGPVIMFGSYFSLCCWMTRVVFPPPFVGRCCTPVRSKVCVRWRF
jgi:hypothetical protein